VEKFGSIANNKKKLTLSSQYRFILKSKID
jgi:hypothetical protein